MGFKENLKQQLSYSGMYVKELAAKSGVKKQTIDSYLNVNASMPSAKSAVAIAHVLNVSVEYLVTGQETETNNPRYPVEARLAVEIIAKMNEKNRKMLLAIIKAMKKQEEQEEKESLYYS
jgi:transcriptional regulator with XRE-family HTH domain